MYCESLRESSGPVAPATVLRKLDAIPPLPKNLDFVDEGGGGGDCNCDAVGALLDLNEYVLCILPGSVVRLTVY